MNLNHNRVLVLAPHTDDGELGCGGTIAKLNERGADIYYAAFSSCEQSIPDLHDKDILKQEVKNATSVLGLKPDHVDLYDYQVRMFSYKRQEILEDLVLLNKRIKPDLVFIPSFNDIHQDHAVIAAEGLRAFKRCSIFSYELPWNQMGFQNQCFIALEQRHIETKIRSINEYKSQGHRSYTDSNFLLSLAKVRGVQAGTGLAEVFEVQRLFS